MCDYFNLSDGSTNYSTISLAPQICSRCKNETTDIWNFQGLCICTTCLRELLEWIIQKEKEENEDDS